MKNAGNSKSIREQIGRTLAPAEITSREAMADFGITRKDLVCMTVGSRRVLVYPCPAPEEVCREMLGDLLERYGEEEKQRAVRPVSLEGLQEEGADPVDRFADTQSAAEVHLFLEYLESVNPLYASIVRLKNGHDTPCAEVSRALRLPISTVRRACREIRKLAAEYFGVEAAGR